LLFGNAAVAGNSERCGIAVLEPSGRWVIKIHGFFHGMQALPIGGCGGAIHHRTPVDIRVPFWHKISMPVSDISLVICIDRIVGDVGPEIHRFFELIKSINKL
jgi:hypothetical protein